MLLFILGHYKSLIAIGVEYPVQMLLPFLIGAPFIIFLLSIYKTKFFYLYLILFISIPTYIIIKDYVETEYFLATCNETTPSAEYNPIYVSENYFHEDIENKAMMFPNVKEIGNTITKRFLKPESINEDYTFDPSTQTNTIFLYFWCPLKDSKIDIELKERMEYLIKKGNIVLCEKSYRNENCRWFYDGSDISKHLLKMSENCLQTPSDVNHFSKIFYQVDEKMNLKTVAVFFSDYFVGSRFIRKLFPYRAKTYCNYNTNTSPQIQTEYRRSELLYKNYIKLETQN